MLMISILLSILLCTLLFLDSHVFFVIQEIIEEKRRGRLQDGAWFCKAKAVTLKWLRTTPRVSLNGKRFNPFDRILQLNQSRVLQSWQNAGLLLGLPEAHSRQKYISEDGNWAEEQEQIDSALLAYAVLLACEDSQAVEKAMYSTYNVCMQSVGEDGCICYRRNIPHHRFVDTVGFTVPFLLLFGTTYGEENAIRLGKNQFMSYLTNGFSAQGIPYHAYHSQSHAQLGIQGWARGIGWLALGAVGILKHLEETDPEYMAYMEAVRKLADTLIPLQNSDGGYHWNVLSNGFTETSGTAMIGWLFIACYKKFQDEKYRKAAQRCLHAVQMCTKENGIVSCAQGDSMGLGLYSTVFKQMPFAQGIAVRLFREISDL